MDFTTYFINNCFSKQTNDKTVTAHFTDGTTENYTAAILNDLKSDRDIEYITDATTGEVIYIKE